MHIDTDQLENEYPPEPECKVNEKECVFTPVRYLCHECGTELCTECAVGVRHQPQMFKYKRIGATTNERAQMHCPDCAAGHSYEKTKLGAGIGGIVVGFAILYLGGLGVLSGLLGVGLVVAGAALLYKEHMLKQKLNSDEIYAASGKRSNTEGQSHTSGGRRNSRNRRDQQRPRSSQDRRGQGRGKGRRQSRS